MVHPMTSPYNVLLTCSRVLYNHHPFSHTRKRSLPSKKDDFESQQIRSGGTASGWKKSWDYLLRHGWILHEYPLCPSELWLVNQPPLTDPPIKPLLLGGMLGGCWLISHATTKHLVREDRIVDLSLEVLHLCHHTQSSWVDILDMTIEHLKFPFSSFA